MGTETDLVRLVDAITRLPIPWTGRDGAADVSSVYDRASVENATAITPITTSLTAQQTADIPETIVKIYNSSASSTLFIAAGAGAVAVVGEGDVCLPGDTVTINKTADSEISIIGTIVDGIAYILPQAQL